jgi:hypothetical protein
MSKVAVATLKAIAAKFAHMPDEDITVLERQVAKILIESGYLRLEPLVYKPNCEILEYVVATPTRPEGA